MCVCEFIQTWSTPEQSSVQLINPFFFKSTTTHCDWSMRWFHSSDTLPLRTWTRHEVDPSTLTLLLLTVTRPSPALTFSFLSNCFLTDGYLIFHMLKRFFCQAFVSLVVLEFLEHLLFKHFTEFSKKGANSPNSSTKRCYRLKFYKDSMLSFTTAL